MTWLAQLIEPLNRVLFQLGDDAVSWAELLGFITGGLGVWLTVRRRIANFPVGIANSAFFLVLFASSRLWADSGLQVVYLALGFLGWWQWLRRGTDGRALVVTRASRLSIGGCLLFVLLATIGLTLLLRITHDAAPFWDALTTALSLSAQWLLNARKVQTWWFWIAADCIYLPLYATRHLELTVLVYLLLLGMCFAGLASWRRVSLEPAVAPPGQAAVAV